MKVLLLLLALAASPSVQGAETLRICSDEKSHLPFVDPAGGGVAGQLIGQAAAELGLDIVFYPAPTTRCREEMRVGVADAFPITPYTTSLLGIAAYPMSKGKPDPKGAVLVARSFAYRRTGSAVDWDGKKFIRLTTPVLKPFGAVLLNDRLKAAGVAYDDKGKTLDLIFFKLLAERGDIAVGAEYSGMALLADPRFAGKIEMLPPLHDRAVFPRRHPESVRPRPRAGPETVGHDRPDTRLAGLPGLLRQDAARHQG